MDAVGRTAHRGRMLHDALLMLTLFFALVLLNVAAARWGVDTRRPELLRDQYRLDS